MNARIKSYFDILSNLLRINSVESEALPDAPFGKGNKEALDFVLDLLKGYGFKTKNLEGFSGWGEIGEGEKMFAVLGHTDVVPEGNPKDWTFPPYGGEIHNDILYGRGAEDDKGPLLACIFAAKELLDEGFTPKMRLRFIVGADEESGWVCLDRYFKTEEVPYLGFSPDADFPVIYCEKGIVHHTVEVPCPKKIKAISGGTRANVVPDYASATVQNCEGEEFVLEATGVSSHASRPENGENAIVKLLGQIIGTCAKKSGDCLTEKLYKAFSNCDGSELNLKLEDESGPLTINIGLVEKVGEKLIFTTDIRHPVTVPREKITEILQNALPFSKVTDIFSHPPLYVPKDHFLVKGLLEAYEEVTGVKGEPIAIGGGTYARSLPCGVAFGPIFPGDKSSIHELDECVSAANFEKCVAIYKAALKKLIF
ncbi:MAG: Sapep family Mn(2+)-dependent dipeptidase [Christensenellaceae bacterium]|jgi:succinyl-diaminopimelate desuccinylase|nr:Sapep family Mn(2+)-dependent dipeptidase [Christensenellaceae bacterium]